MTGLVPITVKPRFVGFEGIRHFTVTEGASLEEIALEAADILPPEFWTGHGVICVGDRRVPQQMWRHVRPRVIEGREIAVTLNIVPFGGDPQLMGALTTIAGVAITAAGIYFAQPWLISAGVGIALSGIGMLFAPLPPQPKEAAAGRQAIQAGVAENPAAPFEWLPRVLGSMVYSPVQLIRPYTVYSRRSIKVAGAVGMVGRHQVSNVRINGALASSMTNLTLDTRAGAPGDTALTVGNKWVYEESPRLLLSNFDLDQDNSERNRLFDQTNPLNSYPQYQTWLTRTGDGPDKVVIRFLFPQGMVADADNSANQPLVIPVRIEFRKRGSSTWILGPEFHFYDENRGNAEIRQNLTFLWQVDPTGFVASSNHDRVAVEAYAIAGSSTWLYSANSYFSSGGKFAFHVQRDEDGFTVYLNPATFPNDAHYEFRVKRGLGYQNAFFNELLYSYNGSTTNANFFDHVLLGSLKIVQVEQFKFRGEVQVEAFQTWHNQYPLADALAGQVPLTLIGFEARDMEINSVSAQFESMVPTWNGTNWNTIAVTRNPAALYRHVLVDSLNADPRDLAVVNSGVLEDWHDFCVANSYECNAVASDNEPQVLAMIASAGWAGPRSHEQWEVILERDTSSFNITQNFTPLNSSNYIATKPFFDLPHAFNIEFFDETDDNKVTSEIVYALGFTAANATRFETITMDGFTEVHKVRDRAGNILRALHARQTERRIDVGIEALVSQRGDVVGLSHDLKSGSVWYAIVQSVLTSGANVTGLTLNARATLSEGTGPYSAVLRYANQVVVIKPIIEMADASTITFRTPFAIPAGNVLRKGCLISIGIVSQETTRCRISNILYKDELTATVALLDEAPEIYTGIFAGRGSAAGLTSAQAASVITGSIRSGAGSAAGAGQAVAANGTTGGTLSMQGASGGLGVATGAGSSSGTVSRAGASAGLGGATAAGTLAGGFASGAGTVTSLGGATATGTTINTVGIGNAAGLGSAPGISFVAVPSTSFVYKATATSTADRDPGQTYAFHSQAIGTTHAKRVVICGVQGGNFNTDQVLTINGITMSLCVENADHNIMALGVPNGTSIDFDIIVNATMRRAVIAYGVLFPENATVLATKKTSQGSTTDATLTVPITDAVAGNTMIVFGGQSTAHGTFTLGITGPDAIIEHVDAQIEATSGYVFGSVKFTTTAARTLTLSASASGNKILTYAIFGPSA